MPEPDAETAAGPGPEPGATAGGRAAFVVEPFGDAALLVTLGDRVDPRMADRAQRVAAELEQLRGRAPALGRAVAAHASVLVPVDPLAMELDDAVAMVRTHLVEDAALFVGVAPDSVAADVTAIEIGVRYGGADGPDLDAVAEICGLTAADVIERHAGAAYRVLFLGFAPGFAYLGGLPAALVTPRRASPRERVPAGSVAIAGEQSAVYPLAMPGGWQLIGRTDARLFDPSSTEPALLRPGARVRFVPVR